MTLAKPQPKTLAYGVTIRGWGPIQGSRVQSSRSCCLEVPGGLHSLPQRTRHSESAALGFIHVEPVEPVQDRLPKRRRGSEIDLGSLETRIAALSSKRSEPSCQGAKAGPGLRGIAWYPGHPVGLSQPGRSKMHTVKSLSRSRHFALRFFNAVPS